MANKFLTNIELEAGLVDGSNSTGTSGYLLSSTGTATSWVDPAALTVGEAEQVHIACKNTSGVAISKGDPVYITGTVGTSYIIEIAAADASNSAKMPAVGLAETDLAINAEGYVIVSGVLKNITTDPLSTGDGTPSSNNTVYVKAGGGLTKTKPTGSGNLIQNVGKVGRVNSANAGSLAVSTIMRTNDVPNLTTGKIWVGSSTYTTESGVVHLDESNGRMGIGTPSPSTKLDVSGVITATGGNSTEWNTAYDNSIVTAAVTGTTTKTLTLNQQDGGTVTASWSDETGSNNYVTSASFNTGDGVLTLNRSGLSAVTVDLDGRYLLDTTDTFTGALTINGDIRGNGQQLILNAGESYSYATGQTNEFVYINAESGLEINSSPDNWVSGWAGRNTTTINDVNGNSTFANDITVSGGDITLGGTGRIQGIDTVSAGTDAVNKNYVDNNFVADTDTLWSFDADGAGTAQSVTVGNNVWFEGSNGITFTSSTGPVGFDHQVGASLDTTGVSAGSYTNANITVDAYGRISAASNGSGGGISGSGTTNYVPKWSSSTALTDSAIVSNGSSNVGINISSPSQRLHIGTASNSTATTEEFRIQTGVSGGFGGVAVINLTTGNYGTSGIYMGDSGSLSYSSQPCKIEWFDSSNLMQFTSSSVYAWAIGASTKMYMTSAGNVGIGTTTPAEKLEVVGNIKANKYINQRVAWNSTFTHTSGTGVWLYIPVGYIIEQTSDTYYLNWVAAYGGRVRKIVLRGAGTGSTQTATTTQFRVDINGSTAFTTSALTVTGTSPNKIVTYEFGDSDATFSATDRVQVLFNPNGLWYNAAVGIILEYTE